MIYVHTSWPDILSLVIYALKPYFQNVGVSPLLYSLNAKAYKSPKIILGCGIEDSLANILTDPTIRSREYVTYDLLRLQKIIISIKE